MNRIPYEQLDDHPDASDLCTLHGEPFTGVAYSTWPTGAVMDEWTFRNGEKWGPFREYYSDGRLTASGYNVAGVSHGVWRTWFPDGRKQSVTLIQYGVTVRAKDWDEQGRVWRDYQVQSEPEAQWYLNHLEESRRKYAPLIEAEKMPEEYLRVADADWR